MEKMYVTDVDLAPLKGLLTLQASQMTKRELECCPLLALGYSTSQIAKVLSISVRTVEHHVNNLRYKCQCENKQRLCDYLRKALDISPNKVLELALTRLKD